MVVMRMQSCTVPSVTGSSAVALAVRCPHSRGSVVEEIEISGLDGGAPELTGD